jgi:hypothetical protein
MAKRTFSQCINSEDHQFAQAPADYTLFEIGTFDDELGQLSVYRSQENLGNGINFDLSGAPATTEGRSNGEATQPHATQLLDSPTGENPAE